MSIPENQRAARPPTPPFWRWLMRLTGAFALMLFLTPTVYVVKYYAADRPHEMARAAQVSTARLTPAVSLDAIAPPLTPTTTGNAAQFYSQAIQSYADRLSRSPASLPTPSETDALQQGAHCRDCRFFGADAKGQANFFFRDPDQNDAAVPYRFPITAEEKYRYLSAAVGLAENMGNAAKTTGLDDPHRALLGAMIVRFGEGIGHEEATYTHVQVGLIIKRLGLGLLSSRTPGLQAYVDSQERYKEVIEAKYALLETETPDNLLLQSKIAEHDADPMWRREAVWAIGANLAAAGVNWQRPLEAVSAKATLAQVADRDPDASVRAAAAAALDQIAQHGAVIRR